MKSDSRAWLGEFFGTFLLVFFGCGSVATAVLLGAQVGIFQVAVVWGIGIALAIFLTGSLSGAHLNPAVTLACAVWKGFGWGRVTGYVAAQFAGALAAAAVLHGVFGGALTAYEVAHGIVRGAVGSEASAMIFGEFFPNPGGAPLDPSRASGLVSLARAFGIEALGTALLVATILGLTDEHNSSRPRELTAAMIGLTVTILISLLGPLTMAGFNPARDLAPRVWSAFAGWGGVPFTANGHGWWAVYVLAPVAGGLLGGGFWRLALRPAYARA